MRFTLAEYIKNDVGLGFAPDPTGKVTTLPRPATWFQVKHFAAGTGLEKQWGERRKGRQDWRGNSELAVRGRDASAHKYKFYQLNSKYIDCCIKNAVG